MSDSHTDLARGIELPATVKVVLMVLASRACRFCGLTWPGIKLLTRECGLGETTLRKSLDALVADPRGLARIHAYPRGGRGKATEFVILPGLMELSTAPCGKCRENQGKGSRREGFEREAPEKDHGTRGVYEKPPAGEPENPAHGYGPTGSEPQPERARAGRAREAESHPSGGTTLPPSGGAPSGATPRNAREAYAAVSAMVQGIADAHELPKGHSAKPDASEKP